MPYGLMALLAALAATGWFLLATQASLFSKALAAATCLLSLVLLVLLPQWGLMGLLLQVALVIGVVLYAKAAPST